eukprot:4480282-Lingulodinium_polyedra.AAC.1
MNGKRLQGMRWPAACVCWQWKAGAYSLVDPRKGDSCGLKGTRVLEIRNNVAGNAVFLPDDLHINAEHVGIAWVMKNNYG